MSLSGVFILHERDEMGLERFRMFFYCFDSYLCFFVRFLVDILVLPAFLGRNLFLFVILS